jgi:hypothetical protein
MPGRKGAAWGILTWRGEARPLALARAWAQSLSSARAGKPEAEVRRIRPCSKRGWRFYGELPPAVKAEIERRKAEAAASQASQAAAADDGAAAAQAAVASAGQSP